MSLNIKNERTHELVRRLATLTGMSQTDAVTDAVERRLDELGAEKAGDWQTRKAEVLRLGTEIRQSLTPQQLEALSSHDWLYDEETGLPR
jgi:antitoxin VapB